MTRGFAVFAVAAALVGCANDEKLSPLATTSGGALDAGADAAPSPPPDAGPVKRTIMTRSPFGGPAGNLLVDGDFELSSDGQAGAQIGWYAYDATGDNRINLATETGGLCRSGLRCAILESGAVLYARGAAAEHKGNVASMWAKVPDDAKCYVIRPIVISCIGSVVYKQLLADKKSESGGWCHYSAALPEKTSATCLYVDSTLKAGTTALLDSAMLGPDDGTITPEAAEFWVPDAALVATLEKMQAQIRRTMPVGRRARPPRALP